MGKVMTGFDVGTEVTRGVLRSSLRDVAVEVSIGLHPWERHPERPSRLLVSVDMWTALHERADADGLFLDYDAVRTAIRSWKDRGHVELLETLAEDLTEICLALPRVEKCRVEILKPDIFNDAVSAGIEVTRQRSSSETEVSA